MSTFSNDDDWNISEGDDCWGEGSSTSIRTLQQQVDLLIGQVTTLISTTNDLGGNLANHINANVVSGEDVHRVNDKYNGIFESLRSIQSAINNLEYSKQNNMTAVSYPSNRGEGYYFTPDTITVQLDSIFQSLDSKQDALQVDTEPTAGHGTGYYVTSAGIKAALDSIEAELLEEAHKCVQVVWEVPVTDLYYNKTILYLGEDTGNFIKGNTYYWTPNTWHNVSQIQYTEVTIPAGKYVKVDNWEVTGYPSLHTVIKSGIFVTKDGGGKLYVLPGLPNHLDQYPNVVYNSYDNLRVGYVPDYGAQGSSLRSTVLVNTGFSDITLKVPNYSLGIRSSTYDISNQVTIIGETPQKPVTNNKYVLKTTVTQSQSESEPNYISYSWEVDTSDTIIEAVYKTSPIGLIASWWVDANPNIPEGWYKCDGRRIIDLSDMSTAEKVRLATVLGNEDRIPVADNMIILGYYPFAREA